MEAERKGRGPAPGQGKIKHREWNKAHEGIKDQVFQDRKRAQQCTRCGMNNHNWANYSKTIPVSTIGTQPRRQLGQRPRHPTSRQWKAGPITPFRRPQTSTMTKQKSPEGTPVSIRLRDPCNRILMTWSKHELLPTPMVMVLGYSDDALLPKSKSKNAILRQVDRTSP